MICELLIPRRLVVSSFLFFEFPICSSVGSSQIPGIRFASAGIWWRRILFFWIQNARWISIFVVFLGVRLGNRVGSYFVPSQNFMTGQLGQSGFALVQRVAPSSMTASLWRPGSVGSTSSWARGVSAFSAWVLSLNSVGSAVSRVSMRMTFPSTTAVGCLSAILVMAAEA